MSLDEEIIRIINLMHIKCCGNAREAKRRLEEMGINISNMTIINHWRAEGYEPSPYGGRRNFKTSKERRLSKEDVKTIKKYLERYEGLPVKEIKERIKLGTGKSYESAEIVKVRDGNYPLEGRL